MEILRYLGRACHARWYFAGGTGRPCMLRFALPYLHRLRQMRGFLHDTYLPCETGAAARSPGSRCTAPPSTTPTTSSPATTRASPRSSSRPGRPPRRRRGVAEEGTARGCPCALTLSQRSGRATWATPRPTSWAPSARTPVGGSVHPYCGINAEPTSKGECMHGRLHRGEAVGDKHVHGNQKQRSALVVRAAGFRVFRVQGPLGRRGAVRGGAQHVRRAQRDVHRARAGLGGGRPWFCQ